MCAVGGGRGEVVVVVLVVVVVVEIILGFLGLRETFFFFLLAFCILSNLVMDVIVSVLPLAIYFLFFLYLFSLVSLFCSLNLDVGVATFCLRSKAVWARSRCRDSFNFFFLSF